MKNLFKLILLLTLLTTTRFVMAANLTNNEINSGAYVDLGLGFASYANAPQGLAAVKADLGYNFNQYFAAEFGYNFLTGYEFGLRQNNNVVDMALKGTFPLSNTFSVFGKVGGGINYTCMCGETTTINTPPWYINYSDNVTAVVLIGGGGSFKLSEHFNLLIEDNYFVPPGQVLTQSMGPLNIVSTSIQYNF